MDSCVNIYRSSVYSNSLQFLLWSKLLGDSKYLVIQGEKQYYHGYQRKQHGVNFVICFSNVFFENP